MFPIINWGVPTLSSGTEIVRWHARHHTRFARFPIDGEAAWLAPHVRTIQRDVERNVSHDVNSAFIRVCPQREPLFEERILRELMIGDGLLKFFSRLPQSIPATIHQ
jgi:hypothetical protein